MKVRIGKKHPLVNNLLIIEGISRSGKFLLGNIINGFDDIEPVQYSTILEQIPFLSAMNLIEKDTAGEILRCEVDTRCYETLIGRNLNLRRSDKSSIYNIPNHSQLIRRAEEADIETAIENYYKKSVYSPFVLHETMPNIGIYFEEFPQMKCISITRNSIDLAYSWYKRGLGKRWGIDPLLFQIPLSAGSGKVFPWFAAGWEVKYLKSSEVDRAILSIISLVKKSQKVYKSLPTSLRKKILFVSFDDLMLDPNACIKEIGTFLGKKPAAGMKRILEREGLPSRNSKMTTLEKLEELKLKATKKHLEELLEL